MVNRAIAAWANGVITGALHMYIKEAFPSIRKDSVVNGQMVTHLDGDIIQWAERCLSKSAVAMIVRCNVILIHPLEVAVPQGSLVSLIIFGIYTPEQTNQVNEYMLAESL